MYNAMIMAPYVADAVLWIVGAFFVLGMIAKINGGR